MTRKDYVRLAEDLAVVVNAVHSPSLTRSGEVYMAGFHAAFECVCAAMKRENPNFSHDKFRDAVYQGRPAWIA